jgi:hypothetical protein
MYKMFYASLRFFALGLVLGLLTAPRTGRDSRRLLWSQANDTAKDWWGNWRQSQSERRAA